MKKSKKTLIAVSALALRAAAPTPAFAQILISCAQDLRFGNLATCAKGALILTANGATSTTGCAVISKTALPAQCTIKTGGVPPTTNVNVQFTAAFINIKNGGKNAKVSNFEMIHTGTAVAQTSFTFTPTEVSNTVTIDIGGTLNFNNQTLGSYTGTISVTAN
ncbi:MAG: DUF4402 domain-containing protein [Alphaproteobacteria bacterium]|nr:DUF4402 domain-containing protein [Alphaproteobacteria bacterium]